MASNNDFFVKFGDNARTWTKELERDLQGAQRAISAVNKNLADLETTAANRRRATSKHLAALSKQAEAVQAQIDRVNSTAPVAGIDSSEGEVRNMAADLARYTAGAEEMWTKLARTVELIGRAGEEFQAAATREKRSAGQTGGATTQANNAAKFPKGTVAGDIDPVTKQVIRAFENIRNKAGEIVGRREVEAGKAIGGRYVPSHQELNLPAGAPIPGAVMRETQVATKQLAQAAAQLVAAERASATNTTAQAVEVSLKDIPEQVISDASFDRVVQAVERNVDATKGVEAAIDRLAARLNVAGARSDEGAPGDKMARAARDSNNLTREDRSLLNRQFGDELNRILKEQGAAARDERWKQIVTAEQALRVTGASLITPETRGAEAADVEADKLGKKRRDFLTKGIDDRKRQIRELDDELEQLGRVINEGRDVGVEAEFGRKMKEKEALAKRLASDEKALADEESRAAQRERQRMASIHEAQRLNKGFISPEERARRQGILGQLSLGADEEKLRSLVGRGPGKLGNRELKEIADTFTSQGYRVDYGPVREDGRTRLSNDELVKRIADAGRAYKISGQTNEDLTLKRAVPESKVSSRVQDLVGRELAEVDRGFTQFLGKANMTVEQAYQILGQNRATGGDDPTRRIDERFIRQGELADIEGDVRGYRKPGRTKGRLQVGASVGEEGRDELEQAAHIIEQFQARRALAAKRDVAKILRTDPSFNPYEEDLFGQVEGKGEQAKTSRRNLAAMDQALRELDEFAVELGKLDDALNRAQDYQQRVINRMGAYERGESDDSQQYQRDREGYGRVTEEIGALRDQRDQFMRAYNIEGGTAQYMLDPTYRRELAGRMESRKGYDVGREIDQDISREQYQNAAALRGAIFDYFGGSKIFATEQGNTRDYFSRNLPGVRRTGRQGREALEFVDSERATDPTQARAIRRMSASLSAYAGNLNKLITLSATGVADEEDLNKIRAKIEGSLGRLLSAYQTAFKEAQVPDARLFLPPQLKFDHNLLDRFVDSGAGTTSGAQDSFAAGEIRRQNRSGDLADQQRTLLDEAAAAYNDPGRSEKNRKELIKALNKRLSAVKKTIKEFDELHKAARDIERQASRELHGLMGKDSVARVGELEQVIKNLETERTAADRRGDKKAVATYTDTIFAKREAIDQEYAATPAIEEARQSQQAAIKQREAAEVKLRVAKQEQADLQLAKKTAQGRVDESDLKAVRKRLETAEHGVALAEKGLERVTASLTKAREERTARELAARERLSPSLQPEFDRAIALREDLTKKAREYEANPDLRSTDQAKVDAASSRLANTRAELRRVETGIQNLVGLSGALDPRTHDTARRSSAGEVETGEFGGVSTSIEQLQQQESQLRIARGENARAADRERAALEKMTAVFNQAEAARGRGGSGGGTPPPTNVPPPVDPGDQGPSGDGILNRILRAVLDVNKTLQSGLKVSGVAQDADGTITPKVRRESPTRGARSTPQARADFETRVASAVPAIAQLVQGQDELAKGAALVSNRILSESRVVELFRDRLVEAGVAGKELREQTKAFAGKLGQAVGDERLRAAAGAAEEERQKQEAQQFKTRTGESMSYAEARTEMREGIRQKKASAKESERVAQADRTAAFAAQQHAAALKMLSSGTQREIGDLARMARSTKDQTALAARMTSVYAKLANELSRQGAGATDIRQMAGSVFQGAGIKTSGSEIEALHRAAQATNAFDVVDKSMASGVTPGGIFGEQSKFTQALFGNHGFWSRIMASTGTFVVRNFAAGFVFGLTAALQQVIDQAIQTEATFVRVSHALEATGRGVGDLRGRLQDISTDTGTALNDVYMTAAGLVGLFQTEQEIAGATRVVAQLQAISAGALNAQEAMGALASIQGAFSSQLDGGVDGLQHIADVLTVIQNVIGTNIEVTAEGIGRMSGLANQLGLSLEETGVYVAQIAKLTNQTGAAAGEQLSRVLASMQTGRGRNAITEAFGNVDGRDTNIGGMLTSGNYSQVLRTMSSEWANLTDAQRSNVAVTVAGQRQAAAFAALMNNGAQSLNAITRAEHAHGEAQDRMQAIMKTLNKQIDVLGTNFQNLASNLVRSGVLNFLGLLLKVTNLTLGTLNDLLTSINDIADANPFLDWLRTAAFGLVGIAAAVTLVTRSFRGLKATIADLPAVNRFREGYNSSAIGRSPVSKPRFSEFGAGDNRVGVGSPLSRGLGFSADRFLGRPMESLGRGFDGLGRRLNESAGKIDAEGRARTAFTRRLLGGAGAVAGGLGAGVGGFAGASRATFQGRGQQYFSGLSTRLSDRADLLRTRAGYTDLFGAAGLAAGEDPRDTRTTARQAQAMRGLARASELGARGTSRVSSALGRLAETGIGADLAIGGVIAALALWISDMRETAKVTTANRENIKTWRDSLINQDGKSAKRQQEEFVGRSSEELKRIQEPARDGSWWDAGIAGAGALMGNLSSLAPGGRKFEWSIPDVLAGRFGIADGGGETQGLSEARNLLERQTDHLRELAASPAGTGDAIRAAQSNISKNIAKRLKEIQNDDSLTAQQKTAAIANLEAANKAIESEANNLAAVADGLANSVALSSDQVEQVRALIENMRTTVGQTTVGGANVVPMVRQQLENTGVDLESEIGQTLQEIAFGGLSSADIAVKNEELLREEVISLQSSWLSKLRSGDDEGAAEVWGPLQQALNELSAAGDTSIQAIIDEADGLAEAAGQTGDFGAAIAAQRRAIRRIQANETKRRMADTQANMAGVDPRDPAARPQSRAQFIPEPTERDTKVQNQLNQRFQGMLETKVARVSQRYDEQIASATNSATKANLELEKASAIKDIYDKAQGNERGLEADARQIQQSKLDWIAASQAAAETAASLNIARMTDRVAGIWNVAEREAGEEAIALQQWRDAQDLHGKGSPEAKGAHTALVQKRMSNVEARDARAQARREAELAAIDPQNTAAVNAKQLSNARANLRAALKYGENSTQYQNALAQFYQAQQQVDEGTKAVATAQLQLAQAFAEARGDAVGAAAIGMQLADAALAEALQASGGVETQEVVNARISKVQAAATYRNSQKDLATANISVLQAQADAHGNAVASAKLQARAARAALSYTSAGTAEHAQAMAQLIAANDAIGDAQNDFIQSRVQVSIALAEAAGHTVKAARLQIRSALAALRNTTAGTAEHNAARAQVIQARAGARDAVLQDQLDTIDFNLEMGRTTQSAAISALRNILRTSDLTKQQRRELMLRIKGMQEELSGSPWNFGDIKLPKPYLMRRYIAEQREANTKRLDAMVGASARDVGAGVARTGVGSTYNDNRNVEIKIHGGNLAEVRKVVQEVVGRPGKTRTTAPRRGRR